MKQFIFILFFLCAWSGEKNNVRASEVVNDIRTVDGFSSAIERVTTLEKIFECRRQLALVLTPFIKKGGKIEDRESFHLRTDQKVLDLLDELKGLLGETLLTDQEKRFIEMIPLGVKYAHPYPNYVIEEDEARRLRYMGCKIWDVKLRS